ncbi:MAG: hypothetical protein ACI841_003165 [Planctomycetota bacterium]|jgi:hypothetical protein
MPVPMLGLLALLSFASPQSTTIFESSLLRPADVEVDDMFGYSIALDDAHVVIGAHVNEVAGLNLGAAYVYAMPQGTL